MRKNIYWILLLMLTVSVMGFAQDSGDVSPEQMALGSLGFQIPSGLFEAPDFTLKDLDGKNLTLSSLRGKFVFLNFWATWCPPCRAEMPSMQVLHEKYKNENFVILAVNLREDKKTVEKFLKKNKYTFPVVMDVNGDVGGSMYGVSGIPTTYFIGADGYVLGRLVGTREWDTDEVYSVIEKLFP